jgi:glycosyltransferase involved in cell wall biosynthesis
MNLSIIIPLYNEAGSISSVIDEIQALILPEFVKSMEIIVVDDCSTDASYAIVSSLIVKYSNLILLKQSSNLGKGASVRFGIVHSKGDVFLIQDADTELSPRDIPSMLIAMNTLDVEFVNGSRYLPGICRPLYSYKRYLANKFFTFLTSIAINVKLTDMACGYKIIHKNLYKKLKLKENRFGFEAELLIKSLRIKKNNIAEVPVQYFPRNTGEGKKLRPLDGLKILLTVIKYGILKLN